MKKPTEYFSKDRCRHFIFVNYHGERREIACVEEDSCIRFLGEGDAYVVLQALRKEIQVAETVRDGVIIRALLDDNTIIRDFVYFFDGRTVKSPPPFVQYPAFDTNLNAPAGLAFGCAKFLPLRKHEQGINRCRFIPSHDNDTDCDLLGVIPRFLFLKEWAYEK